MTRRVRIPIRFRDIDAMGHVNNAVYLSYFEEARIMFFNELVEEEWDWTSQGVILARNEVEYLYPIFHKDILEVAVSVEHIGSKSMTVGYSMYTGSERLCAKGSSVLVAYDHKLGKTIHIPALWRERFTE